MLKIVRKKWEINSIKTKINYFLLVNNKINNKNKLTKKEIRIVQLRIKILNKLSRMQIKWQNKEKVTKSIKMIQMMFKSKSKNILKKFPWKQQILMKIIKTLRLTR